ncbi:hypothetical protein BDV23DRAFT_52887 [Aspergillus alliaceus]|uniref:Uncharacterized protein n=1 Tax=Petromyces alliaceus TaxID=209559 RepID=A0A5N7CEW7_PETAA|nr:hypothetical protein BDV23DRAFT_52887 [Aspergillus alliaceus]
MFLLVFFGSLSSRALFYSFIRYKFFSTSSSCIFPSDLLCLMLPILRTSMGNPFSLSRWRHVMSCLVLLGYVGTS